MKVTKITILKTIKADICVLALDLPDMKVQANISDAKCNIVMDGGQAEQYFEEALPGIPTQVIDYTNEEVAMVH